MKFKAHQSFFIRKGWLGKGLRKVAENEYIFIERNGEEAMDKLGLGSNMVKSLRYWMQACELATEPTHGKRHQSLTQVGKLILERDPHLEETGTLWAVHVNLVSQAELATSWFVFFNEFAMRTFTAGDFVETVRKYVAGQSDKEYSAKSFEDDFSCILQTYVPYEMLKGKPSSPENLIDCPLGDLGLIEVDNRTRKTYRKCSPTLSALPREMVAYTILRMLQRSSVEAAGAEVAIDGLLHDRLSPGKLMNLDSQGLLQKLYELEDAGFARVVRTAGLDVIRICDAPGSPEDQLRSYYDRLG